jgi:pyruvate dehydrogenase E2 component (dihydrolipoamide acetyltransferase)
VATEIRMPQWGMAMKEGAVVRWMKAEGDSVAADEPLLEVESAKTVGVVPAPVSGVLTQIAVPEGATVSVQALLAVIAAPGETLSPALSGNGASPTGAAARAAKGPAGGNPPEKVIPAARKRARELGIDLATVTGSGPGGRVTPADVEQAAADAVSCTPATLASAVPEPVTATPVARKLARELGLDLALIPGSGPGGRIVKEDVESFVAGGAAPSSAAGSASPVSTVSPASTAVPVRPGERIPVRGIRKVIAERMTASLRESAQLTMGRHVAMDAAAELRDRLVASWAADGIRPTYTDLVVVAVSRALRAFPLLNSRLTGTGDDTVIEVVPDVHVGLAVATADGLLVPVVRDADRHTLRDVAQSTRTLAERARARTLGMDDLTGSTFTVTALGAAGVEWFTPILNPPEVGILGVGAITEELRPGTDGPRVQRRMTLSLTVDHRVIDGAPAGEFLACVAGLLEDPYRILS